MANSSHQPEQLAHIQRLQETQAQYDKITRVPYLAGYTDYTAGWVNSPILFLGAYFLFEPKLQILDLKRDVLSAQSVLQIDSLAKLQAQLKDWILGEIVILQVQSEEKKQENTKEKIETIGTLGGGDKAQSSQKLFTQISKELQSDFPLDFLEQKDPAWRKIFLNLLSFNYTQYNTTLSGELETDKLEIESKQDFDKHIEFFYSKNQRQAWLLNIQENLLDYIAQFLIKNPNFLAKQKTKFAQSKSLLTLEAEPKNSEAPETLGTNGIGANKEEVGIDSMFGYSDRQLHAHAQNLSSTNYQETKDNNSGFAASSSKTSSKKPKRDIEDFNPDLEEEDNGGRFAGYGYSPFGKNLKKLKEREFFVEPSLGDRIFNFFFQLFFPTERVSRRELEKRNQIELSAEQNAELAQSAMPKLFRVLHEIYILIDMDSLAFEDWKKIRGEIEAIQKAFQIYSKNTQAIKAGSDNAISPDIGYLEPSYLLNKDIQLSSALKDLLQLQEKSKSMVSAENRSKIRASITSSLDMIYQQLLSLRQELFSTFEEALLREGASIELLQNQRAKQAELDNRLSELVSETKLPLKSLQASK